jgi:hypothetical protein
MKNQDNIHKVYSRTCVVANKGVGNRSKRILTWGAGTLRDRSFIRSLALRIMYGSLVFLVVETVMEPST